MPHQHIFGLKKAKIKDPRRFKYHKTFGSFPIANIPETFDFGTVPDIKDQLTTEWCTAFSCSYVIDHLLQTIHSPEYIAQKTILAGNLNPANFTGTTPQLSDKVLVKFGSILQTTSPFTFATDDPVKTATPANWPSALDANAEKPIGASFELTSSGYIDLFDAIRATLYTSKMPLRLAVWWQTSWESAQGGIIDASQVQNFQDGINGHSLQADPAIVLKNGIQYLRVPNSWGSSVGDNGYYYFSREAVNKTFYVSAYNPTSDPALIKKEQWNIITKILDLMVSALRAMQSILQ